MKKVKYKQTNPIMDGLPIVIVASVVILIAGVAISLMGSNELPKGATTSSGVLEATEDSYDFGTISMADGNVSHEFTVVNKSSEPVSIEKMTTSCMCTEASLKYAGQSYGPFGMEGHGSIPSINVAINPGEEAVVEAIFDPNAHGPSGVGVIRRDVFLQLNNGEKLSLPFNAFVKP